jgi:hypothetical protein
MLSLVQGVHVQHHRVHEVHHDHVHQVLREEHEHLV